MPAYSQLTGRRHELRVHCLHLGHGIVGDVAHTGYVLS